MFCPTTSGTAAAKFLMASGTLERSPTGATATFNAFPAKLAFRFPGRGLTAELPARVGTDLATALAGAEAGAAVADLLVPLAAALPLTGVAAEATLLCEPDAVGADAVAGGAAVGVEAVEFTPVALS